MQRAAQAGGSVALGNLHAIASVGESIATSQSIATDKFEGLNALPYTLIGTVVFISLAGFIATYYRAKKHVTPQYDDSPPEPGVLRKSHQEKSKRAT